MLSYFAMNSAISNDVTEEVPLETFECWVNSNNGGYQNESMNINV